MGLKNQFAERKTCPKDQRTSLNQIAKLLPVYWFVLDILVLSYIQNKNEELFENQGLRT